LDKNIIIRPGSLSRSYPGYYFSIDNDAHLAIDFYNSDHAYLYEPTAVNDSIWHHGAVTRSNITFRLYLDGEFVEEDIPPVPVNADNNLTLHIGGDEKDNDWYFHGIIDEVRILNVSLTAEEIADIYEEG